MSLYEESRRLNKRIWLLITQISMDEEETKDIINTIIDYGHIVKTCCKNQEKYETLLKNTYKDIAIIDTKQKPTVNEVIIENE